MGGSGRGGERREIGLSGDAGFVDGFGGRWRRATRDETGTRDGVRGIDGLGRLMQRESDPDGRKNAVYLDGVWQRRRLI